MLVCAAECTCAEGVGAQASGSQAPPGEALSTFPAVLQPVRLPGPSLALQGEAKGFRAGLSTLSVSPSLLRCSNKTQRAPGIRMFSTAADKGGGSQEDTVKPTVLDQAHWDAL